VDTAIAGQPQPRLHVQEASGPTRAVALVLHGGKARSVRPASRRQLSALRMLPFARGLHRAAGAAGLTVWTIGYRDRGWTGRSPASQVHDALWALAELERRHPGVPVHLVGHSLGGRVAIAAGGHPAVAGLVLLAPWVPEDEDVEQLRGRRVLVLHGTRDRWVVPSGSLRFAERARAAGVDVRRYELRGTGHAMLRRRSLWQGLTTYAVTADLLDTDKDPQAPGLRVPL
jgi:pimeloyl-ACP methyl ester carboxylesterase